MSSSGAGCFVAGYQKLVENRRNGGPGVWEVLLYHCSVVVDISHDRIRIRQWGKV